MFQTNPKKSDPLSVILKLVGSSCNLDCIYCYEKRKPCKGSRILQPQTLEKFLEVMGERSLSVELHGGEPLLYPKKKMIALMLLLQKYPGEIALRIQTNSTLLDIEWLELFELYWPDIQFGISLDGDMQANELRVDMGGGATHGDVENSLKLLESRGYEVGVIAVITHKSVERAEELLDYFSTFPNIRIVKFAPCFDYKVTQGKGPKRRSEFPIIFESGVPEKPWSISPKEYADFLLRAWRYWIKRNHFDNFLLEPLMSVVRRLNGQSTADCHFSDRKCAHVYTLYPDGILGSCDEFDQPPVALTNVLGKEIGTPVSWWSRSSLSKQAEKVMKVCDQCDYYSICGGGCSAIRIRYRDSGYFEDYCDYRKSIINEISKDINIDFLAAHRSE